MPQTTTPTRWTTPIQSWRSPWLTKHGTGPAEVSRIMAQVVGINARTRQDQTIYDPTCGSGSLLVNAADEAPCGLSIYGQKMDVSTWAPSIEKAKPRVAERVRHSGHDIPERRCARSLSSLLDDYASLVD